MKPFSPHASLKTNPLQLPLNRGRAEFAPPLSRGGWEGFNTPPYLTNLFLTLTLLTCIPAASADTLGRLFFSPEQRRQLDYAHARNAPLNGNSSAILTVNGIVQKDGGARTVWVNGVSQNADNSGERTPTAQTVNVPGQSRPVKLKVGDKILLDHSAPASQGSSAEQK